MVHITLTEGGDWEQIELTSGQEASLRRCEFVEMRQGTTPGLWLLRDKRRSLVGSARFGSGTDAIEVRIAPKVPVERLMFLVGYTRKRIDRLDWRDDEVDAGQADGLLPAAAHAFSRAAERALGQGVLLGYRETEESSGVVRGRVREAEQMRRHYTFPVPVEISFDDYSADIPENRILLAAAQRLLKLPEVPAVTRTMLRHLLVRLVGVSGLDHSLPIPTWTPTRLNARYHTALGLAELVLRGASYELDNGTRLRVDGLVLLMWKLFEDFVTTALTEALRQHGGRCHYQDERHHLDQATSVPLRPDLVYDRPQPDSRDSPFAVIDAKYKLDSAKREDLYQMLAYCIALGVRHGHLVSAGESSHRQVHRIHHSEVEIIHHVLDLSKPPRELLEQVTTLAAEVAGKAAGAGPA